MAASDFVTYRKFNEEAAAMELASLLAENEIEYHIENNSVRYDPSFVKNDLINNEFVLKLKKEDFEKSDEILLTISQKIADNIGKDHYLFEFTDEELMEIITKPYEWNTVDYLLAQKILKERGKEVNPEVVAHLKKQKINELSQPEDSPTIQIYVGYIFAVLGGLIGIFIGLYLYSQKKTTPTGDKIYTYTAAARKHGLRIFILGIICFAFWAVARIQIN